MALPDPAKLRALIATEMEGESTAWEVVIYRTLATLSIAVIGLVASLWSRIGPRAGLLNLLVALGAAAYFALCSILVRRADSRRQRALRLVSTVVEASLGSLALYAVALGRGGAWAQSSPALFLYAIAILIAAARMRPLVCLFSTAVVVTEYVALYYLALLPRTTAAELAMVPTLEPWAMWNRVFWLVLCGVIAAVTTDKARQLMLSTGTLAFERRRIEHEFGRYVSRDVADAILHGKLPDDQAQRRNVSVLFCDLRDFTQICERVRPEEVVRMLNVFFEQLCDVIAKEGGTVNKFLGDGVLALFGAPAERPDHVDAAVKAAFAILRTVDELRRRGGLWQSFEVGIGLDTGDVVVGPIGAPSRVEYTAIGTVVNRAARLQGLARGRSQRVIVSLAFANAMAEPERLVSMGPVALKGFAQAEEAFTIEP